MIFILDFDRVLFDTDAFVAELQKRGLEHKVRNRALIEAAVAKGVSFPSFVHEGVVDFLTKRGKEVAIVSSHFGRTTNDNDMPEANPHEWQEMKVQKSGLASLVRNVIITARDKREAFEGFAGEDAVIVLDDEIEHVAAARELGFKAFQYQTKRNVAATPEGLQRFETEKTVSSFAEFAQLFNQHDEKAS